jgi:phosphoribosylamine-glycine ligase
MINQIHRTILQPTIDGMRKEGHPFVGILYAGLMMTRSGPKVLEYNARFGDPETQPLLLLMDTKLAPVLLSCIQGTLTKSQVGFRHGWAACVVLASEGYPEKPISGREISGLDTLPDSTVTVFHAGTVRERGRLVTHGGRVLGVTAMGKNLPQARAHVYGAIGKNGIHFDGMHYRKDI